jgi:hypothetical protein
VLERHGKEQEHEENETEQRMQLSNYPYSIGLLLMDREDGEHGDTVQADGWIENKGWWLQQHGPE